MKSKPRKKRKSRSKHPDSLPKGSYRLPDGGFVMPMTVSEPNKRGRRIGVQGIRRADADVDARALAKVLLQMAIDEARRKAEAEKRPTDRAA